MTDTISVLRHVRLPMAKTWHADGTTTPYGDGKQFTLHEVTVDGIGELSALLKSIETDHQSCIVRGRHVGADVARERDPEFEKGRVRRAKVQFEDRPLHMVLIDVDKFRPACDPVAEPEQAIREYIGECLPDAFHECSLHWQLSNSAGSVENAGVLKAHLWFWLDTPYDGEQLKAWALAGAWQVDIALFRVVQAHFTALPVFDPGVVDPVPRRSGFIEGLCGDSVPLVIDAQTMEAARTAQASGGHAERHAVLRDLVTTDRVAARLSELGLIRSQTAGGEFNITCPFADLHTGGGENDTATQYFPPMTRGYAKGNFKCMHGHCQERSRVVWLARLGIHEDLEGVGDAFDVIDEKEGAADGGAGGKKTDDPVAVEFKGIPEAKHLTTDQANAGRIVARFGKRVFVAAGRWHSWDGRRWVADESDVYRYACQLSRLVHAEAAAFRAKMTQDLTANKKLGAIADALDKWAVKCEMKGTIEAAVGLARKMLTIDGSALDRNPWYLNCRNGTVDLRTGELKPHDAGNFITRLADVDYAAEARAPLWEEVIAKITLEEGRITRPVASFLQRWFGYCATGLTREQQFVVHYGSGSNGKSTVLDMVGDVLGDYAGTAAPGLLMGGKDRHPTEIADLFGRRMVTAHETSEGGVLREDFVKQATGGDKIKARFMHADFFEFTPTHKLQLLTNHKPVIKGQDMGIWRRVLLMPYMARFASVEEVRAGRAHYVKDTAILERLMSEKQGVLAWVVQGAIAWAADGLQPPDSVLAASKDYQTEQDRIGQFLTECCELGMEFSEAMTEAGGMSNGLYGNYTVWCKEGGILPLAKNRFKKELERAVPGCEFSDVKISTGSGRRLILRVRGVRLLQED